MYKNLSATVAASNGTTFMTRPRQSAVERAKAVTITLLAIAGIVFAIGAGLGYLLYSQISMAQQAVVDLQAQAGSSAQIAKRYQSTMQSYNDTIGKLSFLEVSVAQNQYVPTLLQQLQTLAIATNLQLNSVKPGPLSSLSQKATAPVVATTPPPAGSASASPTVPVAAKAALPAYDTLPVLLSLTGTYRQVMSFVYALPKFPKILCLKGLSMMPGAAPPGALKVKDVEPVLTATLKIDAYVFNPTTGPDALPIAAPAAGTFSEARGSMNEIEGQINAPKASDGLPNPPPANTTSSVTAPGQAK